MSKLEVASLVVIACLAGCGSERATSSPAAEPDTEGVELELDDPEDATGESDTTEEEAEEATETEEAEEAAEAEAEPAPPPAPKKSCSELTEKACKVTVGCLWSTDKKCVDE